MDAALRATKQEARRRMKSILQSLSATSIEEQSRIVGEKLLSRPEFINARRVGIFISSAHELQTLDIAKTIFQSSKQCFVPRCFGPSAPRGIRMELVRINSWEEYRSLPLNAFGIQEPPLDQSMEEAMCSERGLDLLVMPGLAFDRQGNRLGYGRGYYDRYLAEYIGRLKRPPATIALCLRQQLLPEGELLPYDPALDRRPQIILTSDEEIHTL